MFWISNLVKFIVDLSSIDALRHQSSECIPGNFLRWQICTSLIWKNPSQYAKRLHGLSPILWLDLDWISFFRSEQGLPNEPRPWGMRIIMRLWWSQVFDEVAMIKSFADVSWSSRPHAKLSIYIIYYNYNKRTFQKHDSADPISPLQLNRSRCRSCRTHISGRIRWIRISSTSPEEHNRVSLAQRHGTRQAGSTVAIVQWEPRIHSMEYKY